MVEDSLCQHIYPYLYHHSTPSLRHNITRYLVGECKFLYFKIVIYEQKQISTPNSLKKIPLFNSVSDKENILFSITIFSLSSLRYFHRSFKNPIHICKPPPKSSHMVTLLAPIIRVGVENADGKYHVNHLIIVSQVRIVQIS